MNDKIKTLFDHILNLPESDIDRISSFVLDIVSINQQPADFYALNEYINGRFPLRPVCMGGLYT
ncbi:MAG: hypothetical protein HFI42_14015 [Lachnospiraceae bacterium]|nr:hypothetical protein [Lachnospiraceae bacterium]